MQQILSSLGDEEELLHRRDDVLYCLSVFINSNFVYNVVSEITGKGNRHKIFTMSMMARLCTLYVQPSSIRRLAPSWIFLH